MAAHSEDDVESDSRNKSLSQEAHIAAFDATAATAKRNMLCAEETIDEAILDGTTATNAVITTLSPELIDSSIVKAMQQMRAIQKICRDMDSTAEVSLSSMGTHFSKAHLTNSLDSLAIAKSHISELCRSLRSVSKLDEFTVFQLLPMELRLRIWKAAMPRSRFVSVSYKQDTTNDTSSAVSTPWGIWGCQPAPTILHVCHESRLVALKKYKLRLDTVERDCYVRMDPDEDILVLLVSNLNACGNPHRIVASKPGVLMYGNVLKESALKSIKHIAVEELAFIPRLSRPDTTPYFPRNIEPVHHLQVFETLENLALITYHYTSTGEFHLLESKDVPENSRRDNYQDIQDRIIRGILHHKSTNPQYYMPKVSRSTLT